MAVSVTKDWKKKTVEEILDAAFPKGFAISEINTELEKELQD